VPGHAGYLASGSRLGRLLDREQQGDVGLFLMESPEALQAVDEIVKVPGVDAIMLGPFDLAHALGLPGQTTHKVVIEACREISAKARNNGIEIVWTMFSGSRAA